MFSWNIIGILIWVAIILYLVFIVQNIRPKTNQDDYQTA